MSFVVCVSTLLLAVGCVGQGSGLAPTAARRAPAATSSDEIPEVGWTSRSQGGHYRVSIGPESGKVELGPLQSWWARFETREGRAFRPASVSFSGGMPQHRHGFDTSPRVGEALDEGGVRIEGVRFHMAGHWRLRVDFLGPEGRDAAVFEVEVEH